MAIICEMEVITVTQILRNLSLVVIGEMLVTTVIRIWQVGCSESQGCAHL